MAVSLVAALAVTSACAGRTPPGAQEQQPSAPPSRRQPNEVHWMRASAEYRALALQVAAALADFGERYFLLPNPMYGSWERVPER